MILDPGWMWRVLRHSTAGMVSLWVECFWHGGGQGCWYPGFWQRKRAPARENYRKDWWARQNHGPFRAPQCPAADLKSSAGPPPTASALCRGRGALSVPGCGTTGSWGSLRPEVAAACSLTIARMGSTALHQRWSRAPYLPHRKADVGPSRECPPGAQALGAVLARRGKLLPCGSREGAESMHMGRDGSHRINTSGCGGGGGGAGRPHPQEV